MSYSPFLDLIQVASPIALSKKKDADQTTHCNINGVLVYSIRRSYASPSNITMPAYVKERERESS